MDMKKKDESEETPEKSYHTRSIAAVLDAFHVEPDLGLSDAQVEDARHDAGPNKLRQAEVQSRWKLFFAQFRSVVILVLMIAGITAFAFGQIPEGLAITAVLLVNAVIGYLSEYKAVKSMEAIRTMGSDTIRVRRKGEEKEINSEDLVPGDIVIIEGGDFVPADIRLMEANQIQVNESALTGESEPVVKDTEPVKPDTPLAEQTCMLYKGTMVTEGSGEGVTVATGMATQLGHITEMAQTAQKKITPLQKRLDQLGRRLAWICLFLVLAIASLGMISGRDTLQMIQTAIALGVAAIPEGLPIVATIALARGMVVMARRNALVKKLPAVETLGATRVIFTDKTGTLTENKMTLRRVKTPAGAFDIDGPPDNNEGAAPPLLLRILKAGVLCNNAVLGRSAGSTDSSGEERNPPNKDDQNADQEDDNDQGDPTEIALLRAGVKFGITRASLLKEMPEEREASFNTDVMMMATYHRRDANLYVAVKGAPDRVLGACTRMMDDQGKDVRPLEEKDRKTWRQEAENIAKEGYRLLALADKTVEDTGAAPYEELTFLGLVGLYDPPRKEIQKSIQECHNAGIRVIMATGDQAATAVAIAAQTRIIDDAKKAGVMHGSELKDPEEMSDEEQERVFSISVFARVTPEQKLHLIKLMQVRDITVAMTGDGVNDAPALKKADIGVAMGKRGTDAAREVADMVLLDDAFGSIVAAIHQGRVIFDNIRKSVMFMLCTNVAEIIAVAAAAAAGTFSSMPIPLLPLQILYLNVITDVFPALALGMSRGEPDIMSAPPRPREESILTRDHWHAVGGWAFLVAASVLGALSVAYYGFGFETRQAVTISFLTLAFAKLWFVFNLRNPGSSFRHNNIIRNPYILGSLVLCTALLLAAVYAPGLSSLLKTQAPGIKGWLLILAMSLIPFAAGQSLRAFQALGSEKKAQ
ncbi:MAG TPA: cation-transporting P-type ATPase [Desulfotignum sp.]|nr:cation-transporting P-type ATPase [Desulfotignum sp.]